jgi:hypothetical protein
VSFLGLGRLVSRSSRERSRERAGAPATRRSEWLSLKGLCTPNRTHTDLFGPIRTRSVIRFPRWRGSGELRVSLPLTRLSDIPRISGRPSCRLVAGCGPRAAALAVRMRRSRSTSRRRRRVAGACAAGMEVGRVEERAAGRVERGGAGDEGEGRRGDETGRRERRRARAEVRARRGAGRKARRRRWIPRGEERLAGREKRTSGRGKSISARGTRTSGGGKSFRRRVRCIRRREERVCRGVRRSSRAER